MHGTRSPSISGVATPVARSNSSAYCDGGADADEARAALLGLDEIYSMPASDGEGHKLAESERRALVFAALYYPAHPIAQSWEMMDSDRKVGPARDPEDYA